MFLVDKKNLMANQVNYTDDYAYIIAPKIKNYDTGKGYYSHTVITHPFKNCKYFKELIDKINFYDNQKEKKENITTIEF